MKDLQTPQREQSRSSKLKDSSQSKKPLKVAKKSLSGLFTSVSGEVFSEFTSDPSHFPQFSVSDSREASNYNSNTAQSTPISAANSDLVTPTSTLTSDAVSVERYLSLAVENACAGESLLKQVRCRKVLEEMIKVAVAEHLATVPPGSLLDVQVDRAINLKGRVLLVCFAVWCLGVYVAFFGIGSPGPSVGPRPT